jgi:hypothetical protein
MSHKRKNFDCAIYYNNIFDLLKNCPNLTYFTKSIKVIEMFPNIQITRSQIMHYMKYIYTRKPHESFINDKILSLDIKCSF